MINQESAGDRFVILADESADWKIAGLRQLERLLLALNEWAGVDEKTGLSVIVFWNAASPRRSHACDARLDRIRVVEAFAPEGQARVIPTRLFVHRKALAVFFETTPAVRTRDRLSDSSEEWARLETEFERAGREVDGPETERRWQLLQDSSEIARAESLFLRRTGKPQDGLVSKWINRPLTRPITRFLLKLPITPTAWTLSIFVLPILSCVFLLQGDYLSVVVGTLIYQLYSMLDGCDGEIARAKYLESTRGGRVDDLCDIIGAFLFVLGLGFGLSRTHTWLYAAEGILLAALIALNEWALRLPEKEANQTPEASSSAAYPRHRRLIERAGLSGFGETVVQCVLQLTKRDVGILLFVLLALAGLSPWILHPWLLVTILTLVLNAVSYWRARA